MKNKVIAIIVAIILVVITYPISIANAVDNEPTITIISADITQCGIFEVIGQVEDATVGAQVSFLMCSASVWDIDGHIIESNLQPECIAYIDQTSTGNNGIFIVQGQLSKTWENQTLRFAGATQHGGYYTQTLEIPQIIDNGINIIANNSVIYGCDAYLITGTFYKADNIAASIKEGGNRIYFKLGDKWYDLLDPDALDNSFLVPKNAISNSEVEACNPRYYYNQSNKIKLDYN